MAEAAGALSHLDGGVVAYEVDTVVCSVDDVEHALGHTSLLKYYTFLVKFLRVNMFKVTSCASCTSFIAADGTRSEGFMT
jgi:hypothetical protein